jgi:hypothetical protein
MKVEIKTPVGNSQVNQQVSSPSDEPAVDTNKTPEGVTNPVKPVDSNPPVIDEPVITPPSSQEELIQIDGKDYKTDSNGNALNDDGTIFMSKQDMDALESNNNGGSIDDNQVEATIDDLEKLSGIKLTDKDGNKLKFDFTLESLAKREQYIKSLGYSEGSQKALNQFFTDNPELYKAFVYKQTKGTLEGFSNQPVYKNIQIDSINEQQLLNLVVEAEVKRGKTLDQAKRYANFLKVENALEDGAKDAHSYLVAEEDKEFNSYELNKQNQLKQQIEFDKKYYGTYYDDNGKEVIVGTPGSIYDKIVNKGQFGNYVIPEDGIVVKNNGKEVNLSRRQIFDYIATPITDDGRTKADLDLDRLFSNVDFKLRYYMMNLTGGDLSVFLNREVLNQKSKNIKRTLSTSKPNTSQVSNNSSTKKVVKLVVK